MQAPSPTAESAATQAATRPAAKRTAIVALAARDSGSEVLVRILELLGCDVARSAAGGAEPAIESAALAAFNDRIFDSAGTDSADWLEVNPGWFSSPKADMFREEALDVLKAEFGPSRLFVMSDPRMSRLLRFWRGVFEDGGIRPLYLALHRNPLELASPVAGQDIADPALGHLLWLRHVLDGERDTRGQPRFFTSFDQLVGGWARVADRAQTALGMNWPRMSPQSASEVDEYLAQNVTRGREAPENVTDNPSLPTWLRTGFKILNNWSRAGEKPEDFATLDRISREMNAAAPAFARLIASGQKARQNFTSGQGTIARLSAELDGKLADLQSSLAKHAEAQRKLAEASAAAREAQSRADTLEADLANANHKLVQGEQKVANLQSALEERSDQIIAIAKARSEIQDRLTESENNQREQSKKHVQAERELAELRTRLSEAEQRKNALEAALSLRETENQAVQKVRAEAERRRDQIEVQAREFEAQLGRSAIELETVAARLAAREEALARSKEQLTRLDDTIYKQQTRIEERSREADAAQNELSLLRNKLALTESTLAQRQHETEQTSLELSAVRAEARAAHSARQDAERQASDLRREVDQLGGALKDQAVRLSASEDRVRKNTHDKDDADKRLAALQEENVRLKQEAAAARAAADQTKASSAEALVRAESQAQEALAAQKADLDARLGTLEKEHTAKLAALAAELRKREETLEADLRKRSQELEVKFSAQLAQERSAKASAEKLAAEKSVEASKTAVERDKLEARVKTRFEEIAVLTRLLREKEAEAGSLGALNTAATTEIGRTIKALLDARRNPLLPGRLRLRRQKSLLQSTGLFDREWYLKRNDDVRNAGVDPLQHYIEFGFREGRAPNAALEQAIAGGKTADAG